MPERVVSLRELLDGHTASSIDDSLLDTSVGGVANDSRRVRPGDLFFALVGTQSDGRRYIADAITRGAAAIVVESDDSCSKELWRQLNSEVRQQDAGATAIPVNNARRALALAADRFYGKPSDRTFNIGITGTNGKTSVAWLLTEALAGAGRGVTQFGTLGSRILGTELPTEFVQSATTTPDAVELHRYLKTAVHAGAEYTVCEVSSHSLTQERIYGINWDVGVFTNLSRDHLDYHRTFERYGAVKRSFFFEHVAQSEHPNPTAIVNFDDSFGCRLYRDLERELPHLKLLSFGRSEQSGADVAALEVVARRSMTELTLSCSGTPLTIQSRLVGDYNVSNLLAVVALLAHLDFSVAEIQSIMPMLPSVPGRLERIPANGLSVFVDYAHTPDGLIAAQRSLRAVCDGKLITVFGCGGDRDKGKREIMGKAVRQGSDFAILTSDNPRSEDPQSIIEDVLPGLSGLDGNKEFRFHVEPDRREAIRVAIEHAQTDDIVLIAGKGHERYQEIDRERIPFSDREVCIELLGAKQRET